MQSKDSVWSAQDIAWSDPGGTPEEQRDRKRRIILGAAAKIFNNNGYHSTSVNDLAKALNLSKPAIYYYLKDKEEILFECSRIATGQLHEAIVEARAEGRNGWEKLQGVFRGYARVMANDFGICLLTTDPHALADASRKKLWKGRRRLNDEVREIIEEGIRDGSIAPCDSAMASFALFGAFNWIAYWYREGGRLSVDEVANHFLSFFQKGLTPPP